TLVLLVGRDSRVVNVLFDCLSLAWANADWGVVSQPNEIEQAVQMANDASFLIAIITIKYSRKKC
ncbi:MAG TPA: hypothetical protein DEG47_24280, partial [Cyanobacteria bacterium UBA11148]|nr:hypothetical protein [Cyanobacteria bacterium UBA11148]